MFMCLCLYAMIQQNLYIWQCLCFITNFSVHFLAAIIFCREIFSTPKLSLEFSYTLVLVSCELINYYGNDSQKCEKHKMAYISKMVGCIKHIRDKKLHYEPRNMLVLVPCKNLENWAFGRGGPGGGYDWWTDGWTDAQSYAEWEDKSCSNKCWEHD